MKSVFIGRSVSFTSSPKGYAQQQTTISETLLFGLPHDWTLMITMFDAKFILSTINACETIPSKCSFGSVLTSRVPSLAMDQTYEGTAARLLTHLAMTHQCIQVVNQQKIIHSMMVNHGE